MLHSPYGMSRLSVVCRLFVTLLHPKQRLSGNIFAAFTSLGTWTVCIKMFGKKCKGALGDRAS